jgi:hypothetical protein
LAKLFRFADNTLHPVLYGGIMEAMREAWTDERLDDLTHRVDLGFTENKREFQAIRQEMRSEFQAVRSEFSAEFAAVRSEISAEFAAVRSETRAEFQALRSDLGAEFISVRSEAAAMHRTLVQAILGGFALMLVGFAGTIATILTQI